VVDEVDIKLLVKLVNDLIVSHRELRGEMSGMRADINWLKQNSATRSQFLALAETMNQFDTHVTTLDSRVAMIEERLSV
jgi:hypothetical protein